MTLHAAPLADEFAAAFTVANAVCYFSELTKSTKVPHVLEPSTTSSRCGAKPPRDALESKVQVSMPALTDSASQSLGADMIDDVATQRELAREVCERPVSPSPQPQLMTEE